MERIYTIPLRREYLKVPRWKRAKKSMKAIREFAMRHMKVSDQDDVKISNKVNELVWARGGKKVPPKVTVKMIKEDNIVHVLLPDEELKKKNEKSSKKEKKNEQKKEEIKKDEKVEIPKEEKVEDKKEESKEVNENKVEEVKEDERRAIESPGEQEN